MKVNRLNSVHSIAIYQAKILRFNISVSFPGLQELVLLLLDNASFHIINELELENVHIQFLPSNCTAKNHPMVAKIIDAFKRLYRRIHL